MTRRWWSAISPQLGRSALDIPPFCLLTCPLISSSYMCFTLSLRDAFQSFLLSPSSPWLPFSTVCRSSLFLTPCLDVLLCWTRSSFIPFFFSSCSSLPSSMLDRLLFSASCFEWNVTIGVSTNSYFLYCIKKKQREKWSKVIFARYII